MGNPVPTNAKYSIVSRLRDILGITLAKQSVNESLVIERVTYSDATFLQHKELRCR